jgi:drug/metabolite transporter (DMT)-like permease
MSDANTPAPAPPAVPPPRAPPPAQRHGCLTAIMVIFGIIMLLPGLCALIFGFGEFTTSHPDQMVMTLVFLGLLVGIGGVFLIRAAIRGPRP